MTEDRVLKADTQRFDDEIFKKNEEGKYLCPGCGYSGFGFLYMVRNHYERCDSRESPSREAPPEVCYTCRKTFRTEQGLKIHKSKSKNCEEASTSRSAPATLSSRTPLRSNPTEKKSRRKTTVPSAATPRTSRPSNVRTNGEQPASTARAEKRKSACPSSASPSKKKVAELTKAAAVARTTKEKSATHVKKCNKASTTVTNIEDVSRAVIDRRFSAACQTVGFANIFTLEEVQHIKASIDSYRVNMLQHPDRKKKWASTPVDKQSEMIDTDIKKAFTHFMNKEIILRRSKWDQQLKKWAPMNYKIVTNAADNLKFSVSPDAKSLIYFMASEKDEEKDAQELIQETWSNKSGRSTKTSMLKIRHQEEPEYYISRRIFEEGLGRKEWMQWEKMLEEQGTCCIDVPEVIQPVEMDQFVLYLMRSRELIMNFVVGYEALLFEPVYSQNVRKRVDNALRGMVKN